MPSLDAYCQKLKELADQLSNVDNPLTEQLLVLQLVYWLPSEFDTATSFINQSIPTWETACSMLRLEQHRKSTRTNSDRSIVATISVEPPHANRPPTRMDPQPPSRASSLPPNRSCENNPPGCNVRNNNTRNNSPRPRTPWRSWYPLPTRFNPPSWPMQYGYWSPPLHPHPRVLAPPDLRVLPPFLWAFPPHLKTPQTNPPPPILKL